MCLFLPTLFYGRPSLVWVCAEPSLIRTFLGACGLRSLWVLHFPVSAFGLSSLLDEVQTLPGQCVHSRVGACGLSCLQNEVRILPGWCTQSLVGAFGLRSSLVVYSPHPHPASHLGLITPTPPQEREMSWWPNGEEIGAVAEGEFPKVPRGSFSFWENPPAQSFASLCTRKSLSSHSAHLSS